MYVGYPVGVLGSRSTVPLRRYYKRATEARKGWGALHKPLQIVTAVQQ